MIDAADEGLQLVAGARRQDLSEDAGPLDGVTQCLSDGVARDLRGTSSDAITETSPVLLCTGSTSVVLMASSLATLAQPPSSAAIARDATMAVLSVNLIL
jgi:hypothetical protein